MFGLLDFIPLMGLLTKPWLFDNLKWLSLITAPNSPDWVTWVERGLLLDKTRRHEKNYGWLNLIKAAQLKFATKKSLNDMLLINRNAWINFFVFCFGDVEKRIDRMHLFQSVKSLSKIGLNKSNFWIKSWIEKKSRNFCHKLLFLHRLARLGTKDI